MSTPAERIAGEYALWRARLDAYQTCGKVLCADPDAPEPGTYRIRQAGKWLSVQIWYKLDANTGEIRTLVSLNGIVSTDWRSVWPKCAETPVTPAAYKHYLEHNRRWPDDVAEDQNIGNGSNFSGAPLHEKIQSSLAALEAEAIYWFESIGSMVSSQDQADRSANYAQAFLELEKAARGGMKEASAPIQQELVAIATKWAPLEAKANEIKRTIKQQWLLPWLSQAAGDSATTPKAGSGTAKRLGLATRQFVAFTDLGTFLKWAVDNEPSSKLYGITKAAVVIARRALKNDKNPPGVEAKEVEQVR